MIGYILTIKQKEEIHLKEFAPYEQFYCVQDINNIWFNFVSDQQIPQIEASQYAWLLTLPQGEFIPPLPPPFPYETN